MNKSLVICVLVFLSVASAVSIKDARSEFVRFQRQYNKVYGSKEFQTRFNIFKQNMDRAEQHAKLNPNATFGVTKFMDLTPEEFAKYYKMTNFADHVTAMPPVKTDFTSKWTSEKFPGGPDPTNWDWFTNGACTPVYNQGQCGSCWAFSATETIESYFFLAGNQLTQMSMEQIVDCDTTDQGCNGGFPSNAYAYVQNAGGIEYYSDYPYSAGNGQSGSCNFNSGDLVATVTGSSSVSGESGLYQQASTAGPVSVCVDASSWQYYNGGVLSTCGNNVDHCVQLTGYNTYPSGYWIVRNSWGTDWGQSGFIWIQIGQDLCSIGDYATIVSASTA